MIVLGATLYKVLSKSFGLICLNSLGKSINSKSNKIIKTFYMMVK